MNATPFVSIVMPTYNERETLLESLPTVFAQDYPNFEIILVDDGSKIDLSTDVERIASQWQIPFHFIKQENQGAAAARNTGWKQAKGEIIAFIDTGCHATPTWLSELVMALGDDGAVGGKIELPDDRNALARYAQAAHHYRHRSKGSVVEYIITANAAFKRIALETVGGFRNWHGVGGEDVDISYLVRRAGYDLSVTDQAAIEHRDVATRLKPFARKFFKRGYANYYYSASWQKMGYHRSPLRELIRHAGAVILSPYLALRYAVRRRWSDFGAYWLFVVVEHSAFCLGLLDGIRKNDRLQD